MVIIKLTIAYDGTDFAGWQRQARRPTIQAAIEEALARLHGGQPLVLHGAGRTDAGVHAQGMVASFAVARPLPLAAYRQGLNSMLPSAIRILAAETAAADFHARYRARGKVYLYRFSTAAVMSPCCRLYRAHYPGSFDPEPVRESLPQLLGEHDFTAFEAAGSRQRPGASEPEKEKGRGGVRCLTHLSLHHQAAEADLPDLGGLLNPRSGAETPGGEDYCLVVAGDGFLRHMVRNLAGTLIEIGRGRRSPESLAALLASRDRSRAGATAPACGLTLWQVNY